MSAGRGARARGALGQARAGQAQRQRADFRPAHRSAAARRSTVAWCKWSEAETDDPHHCRSGAAAPGRQPRAAADIFACRVRGVQTPPGCANGATDEETPAAQASLHRSHGRSASRPQLIEGFHASRTAPGDGPRSSSPSRCIRRPERRRRARWLALSLSVPPVAIEKLQSISLTAPVPATRFPPRLIPQRATMSTSARSRRASLSTDPVRGRFPVGQGHAPD